MLLALIWTCYYLRKYPIVTVLSVLFKPWLSVILFLSYESIRIHLVDVHSCYVQWLTCFIFHKVYWMHYIDFISCWCFFVFCFLKITTWRRCEEAPWKDKWNGWSLCDSMHRTSQRNGYTLRWHLVKDASDWRMAETLLKVTLVHILFTFALRGINPGEI